MNLKSILLIMISLFFSLSIQAKDGEHPKSFSSAKTALKYIYTDQDKSFYCGCDMVYVSKNKLIPDFKNCGFEYRKNEKRANRIEWEHVLTAWDFGRQRQCWQKGGRKECSKDKEFKIMEADLHNLVPAIGEVNGDRSNRQIGMIASPDNGMYGACKTVVSFKEDKLMPREDVRGDIARIMFYMHDKYNLNMSRQNKQLYSAWHKLDPVSEEELRIHNLKAKKQGSENPFVTGEKQP